MDLQQIRADVESIARSAGEVVMGFWSRPLTEMTKSSIFDIVTEADKASEALIVTSIKAAFPDHHIVGEEGGGTGAPAEEASYFWAIDPIDGTINFAHKLPLFGISIAMSDRDMRPLVGAVYNPVYDEMFSAARGYGATLNGQPIHVTPTDQLEQAVLATGFPPIKGRALENLAQWAKFMGRARDMRRLGTVALELAFISAGRLDGLWEPHLNSWDVTAGLLLVQEAGGMTTDYSGGT